MVAPQGRRGYFWMLNPTSVFRASLDYTNTGTYGKLSGQTIYQYLYVTSITEGALADLKAGMTLSLGTAQGGWDYGWCRVRGVTNVSGTDVIMVWVSGASPRAGDLRIEAGTLYITVWNDYRLWSLPPYYDDNGTGYYDGLSSNGSAGPCYNHPPVANGGPPVMGWIDPSVGVLSADFDASRSFRTEHTACLGSMSADLISTATITSSSENGGNVDDNVADGSNATYWQPSAALPQWIQFQLPADKRVFRIDITSHTTYAPNDFQITVEDAERGFGVLYEKVINAIDETGWGAYENRSYYFDVDHTNEFWGDRDSVGHRTYRITVDSTNGSTLSITQVHIYAEERTGGATEAYEWDFGDGTIVSGDANSETPGVEFPAGFRYVSLTVEDTNGYTGVHYIPVLALGVSPNTSEISYAGSTKTASSTDGFNPAANAFDNSTVTHWSAANGVTTGWLKIQLASAAEMCRYGIRCNSTRYLTSWIVEGSNDGSDWTEVDSRTGQSWTSTITKYFPVQQTKIGDYLYYRLTVTGSVGAYIQVYEWDLYDVLSVENHLSSTEVTSRELSVEGQQLTATIHDDISSYPDGTLVMYGEREWFDGTEGASSDAEYPLVNRAFLKFWGWVESEEPQHAVGDRGEVTSTSIVAYDVGRRLATLPGWNLVFQRKYSPSYSYEMRHPNLDRLVWFIGRYISNAVNVTDFFWSGTGDFFPLGVIGVYGADLYSMMDGRCAAAGFRLTCNKFGQLRMRRDQNLTSSWWRDTDIVGTFSEADYYDLQFVRTQNPRYSQVWSSGIAAVWADHDSGGFTVDSLFVVSPGQVPVQGVQVSDQGEQIAGRAEGYVEFYQREANRYENRYAPRDSGFSFTLCAGNDIGLDPAEMWPLTLDLASSYAAERGQTFSGQKMYPVRVVFEYNNEAFCNTVTVECEKYYIAPYNSLYYTP